MVARIKSGTSLKGALNYNERKVKEGKALLLTASRFYKDAAALTFKDKLLRLQKLALLNERVKTNCLHLSLNFHPDDKLNPESLEKIADAYMQRIGFGNQPYLVYQHLDAHHTHLHIITTNIQKDGSRLSLHNLGRGLSETTRKQLEQEFGLVQAEGQQTGLNVRQPLKKLVYGHSPTKQALSQTVWGVLQQYAFASLPEMNAILKCYGVTAYRGEPGSRMYEQKGLLYSLLDEKGARVGIPLKASALYGKPTLSRLEGLFEKGMHHKKGLKREMINQLQPLFRSASFTQIEGALKSKGIDAIYQYNGEGFLYGVTYVDHQRKVVFKGSELGKAFSAAALREAQGLAGDSGVRQQVSPVTAKAEKRSTPLLPTVDISPSAGLPLPHWMQPERDTPYVPYELRKKCRQQKRKHY